MLISWLRSHFKRRIKIAPLLGSTSTGAILRFGLSAMSMGICGSAHAQFEVTRAVSEAFTAIQRGGDVDIDDELSQKLLQVYFALKTPFDLAVTSSEGFRPFLLTPLGIKSATTPALEWSDMVSLVHLNISVAGVPYKVRELSHTEQWMSAYYDLEGPTDSRIGDYAKRRNDLVIEDASGKVCAKIVVQDAKPPQPPLLQYFVLYFDPQSFYDLEKAVPEVMAEFDARKGRVRAVGNLPNHDARAEFEDRFRSTSERALGRPLATDAKVTISSEEFHPLENLGPIITQEELVKWITGLKFPTEMMEQKIVLARLMSVGALTPEVEELQRWIADPRSPQQLRIQSIFALFHVANDRDESPEKLSAFIKMLATMSERDQQLILQEFKLRANEPAAESALLLFDSVAKLSPSHQKFLAADVIQTAAFPKLTTAYLETVGLFLRDPPLGKHRIDLANRSLTLYLAGANALDFAAQKPLPNDPHYAEFVNFESNLRSLTAIHEVFAEFAATLKSGTFKEFLRKWLADSRHDLHRKAAILAACESFSIFPDFSLRRELMDSLNPNHLLEIAGFGKFISNPNPNRSHLADSVGAAGDALWLEVPTVRALIAAFMGPGFFELPGAIQERFATAANYLAQAMHNGAAPEWRDSANQLRIKLKAYNRKKKKRSITPGNARRGVWRTPHLIPTRAELKLLNSRPNCAGPSAAGR